MSTQQLYVKIRGRVLGPFDPSRLQQMVRKGQIGRTHQVSEDGHQWRRAGDYPDLFTQVDNPASANPRFRESAASSESTQTRPQTDSKKWYFSCDGQEQQGPVSISELRSLVNTRQLGPDDLVWREGMADWIAAKMATELEYLFANERSTQQHVNVQTHPATASDSQDLPNETQFVQLRETVRAAQGWVRFIFVVWFVLAAILFSMFVLGLVQGGKTRNSIQVFTAFIYLAESIVYLLSGVLLMRFSAGINSFIQDMNLANLTLGLRNLNNYWILTAIILILSICAALILGAMVLAGALTIPNQPFGLT